MNESFRLSASRANARRAEKAEATECPEDKKPTGIQVARAVLAWRPTKPPGRIERIEGRDALTGETVITEGPALPAGSDGGRALFEGRLWSAHVWEKSA